MNSTDYLEIDAALATLFETHRVLNHAPRLAWGVVRDGKLAAAGGHEADERTVFRIASMTKSFTAAAVLLLRDRGVFGLDDPVTKHAPELATIQLPTADSRPLTIRQLLTMNSGLATDDPWADRHMDFSDDELDQVLAHGALFAIPPGTAMQYSNLGYGLLGRVVLRATGERIQEFITRELLQPLGMLDTRWNACDYAEGQDIAIGQHRVDGEYQEIAPIGDGVIAPMGGLFTTVSDLAQWVAFFDDAFPARDDQDVAPLCRASRREMQQAHTMFTSESRMGLDGHRRVIQGGYGMGLMNVHSDAMGAVVTHSGGLPGFGSNMRWVPGARIGVIAFANVTYARMADAGAAALDLLATKTPVSSAWAAPDVESCGTRLVSLLNAWSDAEADLVFSDNVAMDEPYERRARAACKIVQDHGPLTIRSIVPMSWAEGDIVARGAASDTTIRIEFQLSSQQPPQVQWYEVIVES